MHLWLIIYKIFLKVAIIIKDKETYINSKETISLFMNLKKSTGKTFIFAIMLSVLILFERLNKISDIRGILFLIIIESYPVLLIIRFIRMNGKKISRDDESTYEMNGSVCLLIIVIYTVLKMFSFL